MSTGAAAGSSRSGGSPRREVLEALSALLRATDRFHRAVTTALEPYGLTSQQYNVLRILRGAGEPLPVLEIAERMLERTPGITRLLDRLERKGLVARERCATDRRQVLCSIMPPGRALLGKLDAVVDAVDESAFAALSGRELKALTRLLDAVQPDG